MQEWHVGLAVLGALLLLLGLVSRPLERLPLSPPMMALLTGVALGPQALGVLHPSLWGELEATMQPAAQLSMAIGVMAIALRLPPGYFRRNVRSLAVMLVLVLPATALAGGLLAWAVLDLPLALALLAGAILCATDPIVSTAIASGKLAERCLPERLRHLILAESAANDGLAFPLVMLPILLLAAPAGEAWPHWIAHTLLWQTGVAVAGGAALGYAAARLLLAAEKHHAIELNSFLAYSLALTLLSLGAAELLGLEGVLAVFAGGVAFGGTVGEHERRQEERVQEAMNSFFTLPIFVLIGLAIPWQAWAELGWRGAAFAALVLLLRRLPAVLLLHRLAPGLRPMQDALFAGWFGPVGVAAVFYALLALERTGEDMLWGLASLVVCASIIAHGLTGGPFTMRYARRSAMPADAR